MTRQTLSKAIRLGLDASAGKPREAVVLAIAHCIEMELAMSEIQPASPEPIQPDSIHQTVVAAPLPEKAMLRASIPESDPEPILDLDGNRYELDRDSENPKLIVLAGDGQLDKELTERARQPFRAVRLKHPGSSESSWDGDAIHKFLESNTPEVLEVHPINKPLETVKLARNLIRMPSYDRAGMKMDGVKICYGHQDVASASSIQTNPASTGQAMSGGMQIWTGGKSAAPGVVNIGIDISETLYPQDMPGLKAEALLEKLTTGASHAFRERPAQMPPKMPMMTGDLNPGNPSHIAHSISYEIGAGPRGSSQDQPGPEFSQEDRAIMQRLLADYKARQPA